MSKNGLLDMDGVICDFVRASLSYHGSNLKHKDIEWNFDRKVCKDPKDFWAPLGFDFWSSLPWTPEGMSFLNYCINLFGKDRIFFCTTPCETIGSIEGKIEWLKKYVPDMARQYIITPNKQVCAHNDTILIDDNWPNCEKFVKAGGYALLIPRPWNSRKNECDEYGNFDVVKIVRELEALL